MLITVRKKIAVGIVIAGVGSKGGFEAIDQAVAIIIATEAGEINFRIAIAIVVPDYGKLAGGGRQDLGIVPGGGPPVGMPSGDTVVRRICLPAAVVSCQVRM